MCYLAEALLIGVLICHGGILSAGGLNLALYEGTFPVGSVLLPMNGNQAQDGRIPAYGLAHYVLRHGGYIYRIIQGPNECAQVKTDQSPAGKSICGGPILVLPKHAQIIRDGRDQFFPEVVLETLTEQFHSQAIFPAFEPLALCVIRPPAQQPWLGRTDVLLDAMGIPYAVVPAEAVEAGCSALSSYDLIVDDCVGWFPVGPPPGVIACLSALANEGKEIIFTDLALTDLAACFPGKITIAPNLASGEFETIEFEFHNNSDFVTQYFGPSTVPLSLHKAGRIIIAVAPDVSVAVDSSVYPFYGYAIAAAYFRAGRGIVEGFAYHPIDQINLSFSSEYAAAALYGNKFIEGKPQPRITLAPPTAVNLIGGSHTVTATVLDILGQPKPNVLVTFKVIDGPNAGVTGTAQSGADGQASFTYTGITIGEDTIRAQFEELTNQELVVYESNKVYKTWVAPPPSNPGQAYAAHSADGQNRAFLGHNGLGDDTITAIGGVFKIVPGDNWSNFVRAAQLGYEYYLKNVFLTKTTPPAPGFSDVFPERNIVQRSPSIRLWWPLLYEIPGTKWTLNITYGTYAPVQLPDESSPRTIHFEKWEWTVDIDLEDIESFLDAIHEFPYSTSEVPIITSEQLYLDLKAMLHDAVDALNRGDMFAVERILQDFEMLVEDNCVPGALGRPVPGGPATGVVGNICHPACQKLIVDADYVMNKLRAK